MPKPLDDYVEVSERIERFYEKYPEGSLRCKERQLAVIDGDHFLIYVAQAFRTPDDQAPAEGSAWEPVPGKTNFTRDSELMNAETSAWGRAIAALGFEVKRGIASRQEVMNRRNGGADGGGDDSLSKQSPSAAAVGFASKKQQNLFDRLLKKRGMDSNQVEAVNRFAETLPSERVSKAIDGLLDDDEAEKAAAALLSLTMEWHAKQSTLPYDETA